MKYPACIVFTKDRKVQVYPFLVVANNKEEALGKAYLIGQKLEPPGYTTFAKIGNTSLVTPENARLDT